MPSYWGEGAFNQTRDRAAMQPANLAVDFQEVLLLGHMEKHIKRL
jgi:hypothetical protein